MPAVNAPRWAAALALPLALAACRSRRAANPATPPVLPADSVVRAGISLTSGGGRSGTAFGATLDGSHRFAVTAFHLFSPAGGLGDDILPDRLPISGLRFLDVGVNEIEGYVSSSNLLKTGRGWDGRDARGDLVAFKLDRDSGLAGLPLAASDPAAESRVWLASPAMKGFRPELHPATVTRAHPEFIEIALDEVFDPKGLDGAPVLGPKGSVVGMVVGRRSTMGGNLYAYVNPVSSLRERLAPAVASIKD